MEHYIILALATWETWAKAIMDWGVLAYFGPLAEANGNSRSHNKISTYVLILHFQNQ
jgi:hypothetical protein